MTSNLNPKNIPTKVKTFAKAHKTEILLVVSTCVAAKLAVELYKKEDELVNRRAAVTTMAEFMGGKGLTEEYIAAYWPE